MSFVRAIACDVETTHFDKMGGDVIKAAFVEILDNYTLGREVEFSLKPQSSKYYSTEAEKIHGISYWQASQFPERIDTIKEICDWFLPIQDLFQLPMVYHAQGKFDYDWVRLTFMKERVEASFHKIFNDQPISTVNLAKKKLKQLPNHKLNTVAAHYEIGLDHHQALSDARACALIYCKIMTGEDLYTGTLV